MPEKYRVKVYLCGFDTERANELKSILQIYNRPQGQSFFKDVLRRAHAGERVLIYESNNGRWSARAFIRNIEDEDNVTGHYVTSDTSGYYRNFFLTEPRIYGASVRFSFGAGS